MTYQNMIVFPLFLSFFRALTALASLIEISYLRNIHIVFKWFSSWWLNQPIRKICLSKWVHLPQVSG